MDIATIRPKWPKARFGENLGGPVIETLMIVTATVTTVVSFVSATEIQW